MSSETLTGVATVTQLCEAFGISRAAYYAAKKPRPAAKVIAIRRAPRHTSSEVALAAIREVIKTEPAWGVRKVWATLKRNGLKVSRKRVHALMRANGLVLARDREPGETTRGHVAVPEPNRRFGGDLTTVWTKKDGWVAVVPTIDCGWRSVLGLTVTKDQHGPAVLASVEEALREAFGEPRYVPAGVQLRTDHGPQHTGADCAALVEKWSLVHTFAPVGRPTGNAVAERVIRTMKEEVLWLRDWNDADELREALIAWQRRYNSQRPHQALGWRTPAEYRAEKLGIAVPDAA
jgi:transposase InsO family protein